MITYVEKKSRSLEIIINNESKYNLFLRQVNSKKKTVLNRISCRFQTHILKR